MKLIETKSWLGSLLIDVRASEGVTRLMGSEDSPFLLIAPVPTDDELSRNFPWCNECAQAFFSLLNIFCHLTPDEFLVVPTTFAQTRISNSATELTRRIIQKATQIDDIKLIICVGKAPFKAFFGFGKNPPSSVFSGTALATRETGFKPLFAFPDVKTLPIPKRPPKPNREYYMAMADHERSVREFEKLSKKLATLITSLK